MLEFIKKEKRSGPDSTLLKLELTSERRLVVRQKVMLSDGREAGIFLNRGEQLEPFDVLCDSSGVRAQVIAKDEEVICAGTDSHELFAKACYHLGNRHVPLQIEDRKLYFLPDKVLEQLCVLLGLKVSYDCRPFIPEAGAYAHHEHHEHHEHQI
ncbi:MAG: urease accessory protein UreE [Succinivibrio sp.]|nr:urease accessory protein UreE [Succinivibrio sp.]